MVAELRRFDVEVDGERVAVLAAKSTSHPGGFYSNGAHGCDLSHMTCLEQATGSILIFEDNCDFAAGGG